jgi:serine/threonine-protein kinase
MRLTSGKQVEPLIDAPEDVLAAQISPNGRYIAYQSNESGRFEVYVKPYPSVTGGRWQVSSDGGTYPAWSRSGNELFFLDGASVMTAVPIPAASDGFTTGNAKKLFDARAYRSDGLRAYDVAPDGSRFLMIRENRTVESSMIAPAIFVVTNWFEDVRTKLTQPRR